MMLARTHFTDCSVLLLLLLLLLVCRLLSTPMLASWLLGADARTAIGARQRLHQAELFVTTVLVVVLLLRPETHVCNLRTTATFDEPVTHGHDEQSQTVGKCT